MKKMLFKLFIGAIAFVIFAAIGYPKITTKNNIGNEKKVPQKQGLINRNNSGHFTRNVNIKTNKRESKYNGVIYIGEPTEGLLD